MKSLSQLIDINASNLFSQTTSIKYEHLSSNTENSFFSNFNFKFSDYSF